MSGYVVLGLMGRKALKLPFLVSSGTLYHTASNQSNLKM